MARRAKEPDLGTEQQEYSITEVLERKRRQLDQEIAQFKAEKERDYRVFERRLRDKSKEDRVQDTPQIQCKRGRAKEKKIAAKHGSIQKQEANNVHQVSDGEFVDGGPDADAEDQYTTAPSISSPEGSPRPSLRFTKALHEREKEFQGVFTPSYLPLVEDTPTNQGRRSKELLPKPCLKPEELSAARFNGNAILSSSAETVHPPMTSPLPPARPLSSSVPPEKPSHHRSDSSRSDNSVASLRSSLRDPKQPRSPKRVLFSIDDTLVSPSTSPIAQRSTSAAPKKPADSVGAMGGFEKFEVVRKQNGSGPAVNNSGSNGVAFSLSAESIILKTSPSASGADDFEHLDSDDLFTFDEEMGQAGRKKSQQTDQGDDYDEDVEVDDKKSKASLTGSSPHAGSLPIEIKWPGRREDRG